MMKISLTVDTMAQAAYIQLLDNPVSITREVNDHILVDLDDMGVVVGVEILALTCEIPFGVLHTDYHVRSETLDALRSIQPSISGFLSLTQASAGAAASRPLVAV